MGSGKCCSSGALMPHVHVFTSTLGFMVLCFPDNCLHLFKTAVFQNIYIGFRVFVWQLAKIQDIQILSFITD